MALYAIADLHLSLSGSKPMDVFPGWENYISRIKAGWELLVKPQDTVVVPGDISWAMDLNGALADFRFLDALPGKKVILKGNHDYFWTTLSKMNTFLSSNGIESISILHNNCITAEGYCLCGTRGWVYDGTEPADQKVILREAGRLRMSLEQGIKTGLPILCFLHYPPILGKERCEEILQILNEFNITRCYYGHIHGSACQFALNGMAEGIQFTLISADALRFIPLYIQ